MNIQMYIFSLHDLFAGTSILNYANWLSLDLLCKQGKCVCVCSRRVFFSNFNAKRASKRDATLMHDTMRGEEGEEGRKQRDLQRCTWIGTRRCEIFRNTRESPVTNYVRIIKQFPNIKPGIDIG